MNLPNFYIFKKYIFLVIDDLQEEYGKHYNDLELQKNPVCPGSEEYQKNIEYLNTSIADLKKNPVKVTKGEHFL